MKTELFKIIYPSRFHFCATTLYTTIITDYHRIHHAASIASPPRTLAWHRNGRNSLVLAELTWYCAGEICLTWFLCGSGNIQRFTLHYWANFVDICFVQQSILFVRLLIVCWCFFWDVKRRSMRGDLYRCADAWRCCMYGSVCLRGLQGNCVSWEFNRFGGL